MGISDTSRGMVNASGLPCLRVGVSLLTAGGGILGGVGPSVIRLLPRIGQRVNMTPLTAMQLNLPKALPPAVRRLTPTLRQRMLLVLTMPLEVFDTPKLNQ